MLTSTTPANKAGYLHDAWYPAAWPEEVTRQPLRRVFLDQPVVLYRGTAGDIFGLADRCPHRFAPLSRGQLDGDAIQCPYHGLKFDTSGLCIHNPHGDGSIPRNARVRTYPVVERHGIVWIWMGDAEHTDPSRIVDFALLDDREHYVSVRGVLQIAANYQLVADNLLDLSHVPYLHPQLRVPNPVIPRHEMRNEGDRVWSMLWRDDALPSGLLQRFWPADKLGDARAHMRWDPPGVLLLDVGITEQGGAPEAGVTLPSVHLLAPESSRSTHYFWGFLRNRDIHNRELDEQIRAIGRNAFEAEDKPMIEAQQANMTQDDVYAMKPVVLQPDAAGMRARKIMRKLIDREREKADPTVQAGSLA